MRNWQDKEGEKKNNHLYLELLRCHFDPIEVNLKQTHMVYIHFVAGPVTIAL